MDHPTVYLPNMARIQIITEHDQMVLALDKEKAQIFRTGSGLSDEEIDRNAHKIAGICDQQAPLIQQGKRVRAMVCTLVEEGAYWLAFEALSPDQARAIKQQLEPTVQRMREQRDQQETRQ